jgi:hypothetical protein
MGTTKASLPSLVGREFPRDGFFYLDSDGRPNYLRSTEGDFFQQVGEFRLAIPENFSSFVAEKYAKVLAKVRPIMGDAHVQATLLPYNEDERGWELNLRFQNVLEVEGELALDLEVKQPIFLF